MHPFLRKGLALVFAAAAALGARAGLPETFSIPRRAELDAQSRKVEQLRITQGHMSFELESGNAAYLRADGKIVGLYFKGKGHFSYVSRNTMEFPLLDHNLKGHTKLKPVTGTGTSTVGEDLTQLTVWFAGMPAPALAGTEGEALKAEYAAFDKVWHLPEVYDMGHNFAMQAFNAPDKPLFRAEIEGATEKWGYDYDEYEARSEFLARVKPRRVDGVEFLSSIPISKQEIGWSLREPLPPSYVISHVDLDFQASDKTFATLKAVETIEPVQAGLKLLKFDLHSWVWGDGALGQGGKQYYKVKSILDDKGRSLVFVHENNRLLVLLPEATDPAKPLKLSFDIEGDMLVRHGGDNYWELGIASWWPQGELASMAHTLHAKIRVPKPFVPVAGGDTVFRGEQGNFNVLEVRFDKPVTFFAMVAGRFVLEEYKQDGLTVRVAGYAGLSVHGKQLPKVAAGIVRFYEGLLGKFPFKELNVVERNELGHGQAPAGIIFMTTEAFNPQADLLNNYLASQWINAGFAHEIAHQYWGVVVKMWSHEEQWITEGFAEYSCALAVLNMKGKGKEAYDKKVQEWYDATKKASAATPIPLVNNFVPANREEAYWRQDILYSKGAYLLYRLHQDLGDKEFFRFLRAYQKSLAWKMSCTAHIPLLLKALIKSDYSKFLEDYYWGTGVPPAPDKN